MRPARTTTLRSHRARNRAYGALLLFLALAAGAATAGLLHRSADPPTIAPRVPATVTLGRTLGPVGAPTATPVPTAALGPLAPVPPPAASSTPATVLPPRTRLLAPTSRPTGPIRGRTPGPTPAPTRAPTATKTPTTAPTTAPTPAVASPRIAAAATGSSYRAGAFVRGKVVVSGLPSGFAGDVTLRLHGPFTSASAVDCGSGAVIRTDAIRVTGDGTWTGPPKEVSRRGFYVWQAVLPAGPSSHAATSGCPTGAGRFEVVW